MAHAPDIMQLDGEIHPVQRRERFAAAMAQVEGLRWTGADSGTLAVGRRRARVRLGASESVCIECDVANPPSPLDTLAANHHLVGNLRFALRGRAMHLRADTELHDPGQLAATLGWLRAGFRRALGDPEGPPQPAMEHDMVADAVRNLRWEDDAVVELENAWELRPRLAGPCVPVRMSIDGTELHFQRVVLARLRPAARLDVLAGEALRINARMKHARLAWTGTQLEAEARLHAGQVQSPWLKLAARAVATTAQRATLPLGLLAEYDDLAARYAEVFPPSPERSLRW